MIPARFQVLEALPKLPSGKLDRRALPEISGAARTGAAPFVAPADEIERLVAEAFGATLGLPAPVSTADDFFLALGGDSVGAAQVISRLRRDPRTAATTVRDLYAGRTAAALAARARAGTSIGARDPRPTVSRTGHPVWFTFGQLGWLLLGLGLASAALYLSAFVIVPLVYGRLGLEVTLLLSPALGLALALAYAPVTVLATALAKRALIGRYAPLRAPAFGGVHLRHWMVERVAQLVPWTLLEDTVFLGIALRMLGARVGRDVHVHRGVDLYRGGWIS